MTAFQTAANHNMINALTHALVDAIATHGAGSAQHKEVSNRLKAFSTAAIGPEIKENTLFVRGPRR